MDFPVCYCLRLIFLPVCSSHGAFVLFPLGWASSGDGTAASRPSRLGAARRVRHSQSPPVTTRAGSFGVWRASLTLDWRWRAYRSTHWVALWHPSYPGWRLASSLWLGVWVVLMQGHPLVGKIHPAVSCIEPVFFVPVCASSFVAKQMGVDRHYVMKSGPA